MKNPSNKDKYTVKAVNQPHKLATMKIKILHNHL